MQKRISYFVLILFHAQIIMSCACNKNESSSIPLTILQTNYKTKLYSNQSILQDFHQGDSLQIILSQKISSPALKNHLVFRSTSGIDEKINFSIYDNTINLYPLNINALSKYYLVVTKGLTAQDNAILENDYNLSILSFIPTQNSFSKITDDSLLTLIQKNTFRYFWDFAHPVSGLALERLSDNRTITSGGSGFGIASILVGIERGFISYNQGLQQLLKITSFLDEKASKYHGAFSHWMNGSTGETIPFSTYDNGGDLVETSYLMMGLLCARQYFTSNTSDEINLRDKIDKLYQAVEWNFYQNNQEVLFWHWSKEYDWKMNFKIQGWNECLITYILAASSPTFSIDKNVYDVGWAKNGSIKNGNTYYNTFLPLGPYKGGPLFFEHYTFIGVNPNTLKDNYADYEVQTKNHTLINYSYCIENPNNYFSYSANCWGLTASDTYGGYTAHAPDNDKGVISPTAALSSIAFTPKESLQAARYFYYQLGEKIWTDKGFIDAFSLQQNWFATSFLAIDQGPIICMIENYRSQLLWKLFTSCPEVKIGMKKLGFTATYLN